MSKKLLALALSCMMLVSLLAGCGNSDAGSGNSSTPGGEGGGSDATGSVYWLNFKPESDGALQQVAELYTSKTGVPVKVVTAASGTYSQTLNSEMDKSSPPTLFVIGNPAAVAQWKNYAVDLTGSELAGQLTSDEYTLYDDEGHLVSISYCYECYGIIVNPDLLEQAGHSLDEIKNFDTLKAVVEDIHARAGELGFDAFTSSDMDGSSNWRFTGHMANLEYYYEQEGEEKAGLNVGTENYWAINSKASEADQKATMDFMLWCVNDPEASRILVDTFGIMPYENSVESTNAFLNAAAEYTANGCYSMNAATNFQPNVDDYRAAIVSALNQYNANQTDENWAMVRTAFVDGWAVQYKNANS